MICTNTMHKVFEEIEAQISIPILHIADATAQTLLREKITTVGLLGTRFTMEQDFYKGRLTEAFGIDVITPGADERALVHEVIYTELCQGVVKPESKARYLEIIQNLHARGAQAVILGCTEIALLVQQKDTDIPLYDTTGIHARRGVEFALS